MEEKLIKMSKESLQQMFQLRDDLTRLETEELQIADAHKEAKKRTEAAQAALNQFIDELRTPNLFQDPAEGA